ncbi:ferredoxin--NADP reductase, partial [Cobetia marina]
MSSLTTTEVIDVHHWNDSLFSFRTQREDSLRFK